MVASETCFFFKENCRPSACTHEFCESLARTDDLCDFQLVRMTFATFVNLLLVRTIFVTCVNLQLVRMTFVNLRLVRTPFMTSAIRQLVRTTFVHLQLVHTLKLDDKA